MAAWQNPDMPWYNPGRTQASNVLGGAGQVVSGINGLINPPKNPADTAMPYLEGIPQKAGEYYNPYIDRGKVSGQNASGVYDQMTNDPNAYYDKLAGGYKQSPGYQAKLNAALNASKNQSYAGGKGTSLEAQQNSQQTAHDITDQDFEAYMNHVLGINQTGLQGEENDTNRGFGASGNMADIYGNNAAQKAKLAYEGQAQSNQNSQNNWSNIATGIAQAVPYLFF